MSFNNIINQNNLDYLGNIIDQFAKSLVDYTFDKINKIISVNQKNNIYNGDKNSHNHEKKNDFSNNQILFKNTKPKNIINAAINKFNNNKDESPIKKNKRELLENRIKERKSKVFNYIYSKKIEQFSNNYNNDNIYQKGNNLDDSSVNYKDLTSSKNNLNSDNKKYNSDTGSKKMSKSNDINELKKLENKDTSQLNKKNLDDGTDNEEKNNLKNILL